MDSIAVLIPCYNEARTVAKVVADYRAALPQATVYVYDNNSTDGTADLAAAAGAVVRKERQQGKGNVLRRMFREIDAECYLLVDGDDTYPPKLRPRWCAPCASAGRIWWWATVCPALILQRTSARSTISATALCAFASTACSAARSRIS